MNTVIWLTYILPEGDHRTTNQPAATRLLKAISRQETTQTRDSP
jgi:hypothetical protein